LKLPVGHRIDLHGIADGEIFKLLLKDVVSIGAIFIIFLVFPLAQIVLSGLKDGVVVIDIDGVIDPGPQIDQADLVLELRLLFIGGLFQGWRNVGQLPEQVLHYLDGLPPCN
jgi:hypothetical protein